MARVGHVGGHHYHHYHRNGGSGQDLPLWTLILLLLGLIGLCLGFRAYSTSKVPQNDIRYESKVHGGRVVDNAQIFSDEEELKIQEALIRFEDRTGIPVFLQTEKSFWGLSNSDLIGYYKDLDEGNEDSLLIVLNKSHTGFDYIIGDNIDGSYINNYTMEYLDDNVISPKIADYLSDGLDSTSKLMMKIDE